MIEKVKLVDICNPKQWPTLSSNELKEDGKYLVYGANGVIGHYNEYNHEKETVLITCRGATCGNIHISKEKSYVNGNAMALDNLKEEKCLKKYLYYFLKQYDMKKIISGSAQPQITIQGLKRVEIVISDLEQQRRVIKALDRTQEIIDARKKQMEELDKLIKAYFIKLFTHEKENKQILLKEIAEVVTVGIANSATHAYTDSGIIMFRNQNIKENYLDTSDLIYINPEFANKYKSKELKENDILVTRTGYPGIACLVPKEYEKCQTFTTLIVRLKQEKNINPHYVCNFINSYWGKQYVKENKVGVAQQNFGAKALEKMPILLPTIEIQNTFEKLVNQVNEQKSKIQKSLQETKELQESLMNQYFKE